MWRGERLDSRDHGTEALLLDSHILLMGSGRCKGLRHRNQQGFRGCSSQERWLVNTGEHSTYHSPPPPSPESMFLSENPHLCPLRGSGSSEVCVRHHPICLQCTSALFHSDTQCLVCISFHTMTCSRLHALTPTPTPPHPRPHVRSSVF